MTLKKVFQLALFLACGQSFSQLGVGTSLPDPSAQLDIVSSDKGVLIPRLALTSTTDTSTIANGNVESLMVYNTGSTAGLSPGYYYWANNVWNRLALQEEINSLPEDVTSTNGSITGTAADAALAAMDLEVKVDGATIEVDATNGVQVRDNGITTAKILDDGITTAKILDGNVTVAKVGAAASDANKVMGTDTAGNVEWQDAAILAASLGEDVTSTNGSITGTASDAALAAIDLEVKVDGATIEVDATNGVQVRDNGITTAKILDNGITIAKIADNAVDGTKIQVTGEAAGSMLYNDGTDWVDFPKGTPGQYLRMNSAGTAPEWVTETKVASKRIGEFVYGKYGKSRSDGYLAVRPGTITNGALVYPIWAVQYPEFVDGNNIVFPSDVSGMFLRNLGGYADAEGRFQNDATARPNSNFTTNTTGDHDHYIYGDTAGGVQPAGSSSDYVLSNSDGSNDGENTGDAGSHSHSVTGGGDAETRPRNRAYQLYTIVDTY